MTLFTKITGFPIYRMFATLVLFVLTLSVFSLFFSRVNDFQQTIFEKRLEEFGRYNVLSVENRFSHAMNQLEFVAQFVANEQSIDKDSTYDVLQSLVEKTPFHHLSLVGLDGKGFTTSGSVLDISNRQHFLLSKLGENSISAVLQGTLDQELIIVLSTPVIINEKISGVLVGALYIETMDYFYKLKSFQGQGFALIVESSGLVIFNSFQQKIDNNFFTIIKKGNPNFEKIIPTIEESLTAEDFGIFEIELKGKTYLTSYIPVGINDWYMFTVVPKSQLFSETLKIRINAGLAMGFVILFFVLILSSTLLIQKKNHSRLVSMFKELQIINERFKVAVQESRIEVFSYATETKKLSFIELNKKHTILGVLHNLVPEDAISQKLINPEQSESFLRLFTRIENSSTTVKGLYQLKNNQGIFVWCRISLNPVYDEKKNRLEIIGTCENVDKTVREKTELLKLADYDQMCGVLNKTATEKSVYSYLESISETDLSALFCIDVDDFKYINDTYGHATGDLVLKNIALLLKNAFRNTDIIGRIGGDEFLVCVKHIGSEEKLREKVDSLCRIARSLVIPENPTIKVTLSVGISLVPLHGKTYKELFDKADIALYHSKHMGKDTYTIYTEKKY